MSREGNVSEGEIGRSGCRAKGSRGTEVRTARVARPRNASVLAYSQSYDRCSLESCMLGNGPVQFGKGATEKGCKVPRRCPTSFEGARWENLLVVRRAQASHLDSTSITAY